MKSFVRMVELWVPDASRSHLAFGGSLGSELGTANFDAFRTLSESIRFGYGEGLPGKAWQSGHPVILTEFSNSYFKRTDAAKAAGLTCGVALPVFAGEFLTAVMVLFCGDDEKHIGAIELWHNDENLSYEMALVDGYYGTADMFEFNSRHTKFPRGFGLPGRVWKADRPLIIKDFENSKGFLRWEEASEIGINCAMGIPYAMGDGNTWVVSLLSAQATPIAKRFEIWRPTESGEALVFEAGDCSLGTDLAALYRSSQIAKGEGTIGGTWASGMPALVSDLGNEQSAYAETARQAGLAQIVTFPVIDNGRLKAIVVWLL